MYPVVTVTPKDLAVKVEEAAAHCRIDDENENGILQRLIVAATQYVEKLTGRALLTQTYEWSIEDFCLRIDVPIEPIQSITSIKYYDTDNTLQTLSSSVYGQYSDANGSYIGLLNNQSYPQVYYRDDAVKITFVAGYTGAHLVPAPIKQAILMLVAYWYDNREAATQNSTNEMPFAVDALLSPYISRFGV